MSISATARDAGERAVDTGGGAYPTEVAQTDDEPTRGRPPAAVAGT
jgi:hypothetical protein